MDNNPSDFGAEMAPPLDQTVQMTFHRLEKGKSDDEPRPASIILRTVSPVEEAREYAVPIPEYEEKDFRVATHYFIAQRREDHDLVSDLEEHFRISLRYVLIWESMVNEQLQAQMTTLSQEGEKASFCVSPHTAILYAMLHNMPILVERRLVEHQEPVQRFTNELNDMTFEERYVKMYKGIYRQAIEDKRLPSIYSPSDLEQGFYLIGAEGLRELEQWAVDHEGFEWAQVISDFRKTNFPKSFPENNE